VRTSYRPRQIALSGNLFSRGEGTHYASGRFILPPIILGLEVGVAPLGIIIVELRGTLGDISNFGFSVI